MATTKRCPMCLQLNRVDREECECGYEFGQSVDKVLAILRARRTSERIVLALLVVTDLVAAGAMVYGMLHGIVVISMLLFGALFTVTVRAAHKLSITRTSIRALSKRTLPKATVIER